MVGFELKDVYIIFEINEYVVFVKEKDLGKVGNKFVFLFYNVVDVMINMIMLNSVYVMMDFLFYKGEDG